MAMMITKFHRLIQNKVVWIVFSLLVVISFVFWGMQSPNDDGAYQARAPGSLNGKPVPAEEFYQAEFGSYFRLMLQSGQRIPYTAEVKERLQPLAWKRLISLKAAEDLGLVAGDDEIRNSLANTSFLSPNGRFDPAQYDMFINQALPNLLGGRISKQQFEDHVRREISLSKLMGMVENTALISPADVRQVYQTLNDKFIIDYTLINREDVEAQAKVEDEQVRAYYDENPDVFEIPERVVVRYVSVPVASYLDEMTVEDSTVDTYYEENRVEFQVMSTNADPVEVSGSTNDVSAGDVVTYKPLEEVRDEIRAKLKHDKARFEAVKVANTLVYALTPDQFGNAPSFDEQTTAMELEVRESEPFTRYGPIPAFGDGAEQIQDQAFQLYDNSDEYFSNPVDVGDMVYVLALKERLAPQVPPFEEVADEARPYALRAEISDEMRALGEQIAADVMATEPSESRFADIVGAAGLTTTNLGPFSAISGSDELPSANLVMESLVTMNRGEVSEPLLTEQGLMVAYVRERISATEEDFAQGRESLTDELRQQYAAALFDGWQQQLLDDAEFSVREDEGEEPAPLEDEAGAEEAEAAPPAAESDDAGAPQ